MRVNYFLLISEDGEINSDITDRFFTSYQIEEIMNIFIETEEPVLEIGNFRVDFMAYLVEDSFAELIQNIGWCPGLIWLKGVGKDLTTLGDIIDVMPDDIVIKNTNGLKVSPRYEDMVVYCGIKDGVMTVYIDPIEDQVEVRNFITC